MKTKIGWACILLVSLMLFPSVSVFAIYLNGTSDPSANTTAPTNNTVGWNAVGICNGFTITRTWTNCAVGISSHGAPPIGSLAVFSDCSATVTNVTYDPNTGVVGIRFNKNFSSWAKVSTSTNLNGKAVQVIGHSGLTKGRQIITVIGCPSQPLVITSATCCNSSNRFEVTGGDVGTQFVIQCRTNLGGWFTVSGTCTMPASNCYAVCIPQNCSQFVSYRTMVTGLTTITNGWERGVPCTTKRWGTNTIEQSLNDNGSARYEMSFNGDGGADECATGPDDSNSPGFVTNTATGDYELALLVESGDEGPYANSDSVGGILWGPMIDQRGMVLLDEYDGYAPYWTYPTYGPANPSKTQFTCIGSHYKWLKAHKFVP